MSYSDQWIVFDNDMNKLLDALKGNGVQEGMAVSQRGAGANMSVDVALGIGRANFIHRRFTSTTNVAIDAADGALPRKDVILLLSGGTLAKVTGTPAAAVAIGDTGPDTSVPIPPNITAGAIILAEVWVAAAVAQINNADITDRRVTVQKPSSAWRGVLGVPGQTNARALFTVSEGIALLGTEEGAEIWKTVDEGEIWTQVADLAASADDIRSFCLTNIAGKIVAGSTANPATTPVSIYKSLDYGVTWAIADTINAGGLQPGRIGDIVLLANNDLLCGTRNTKIFRSQDNGDNWAQLADITGGDLCDAIINLGGTPATVLAGTGGPTATPIPKIWKSVDSGATWTEKLDLTADEKYIMCLFETATGRVLAGCRDSGGIWKSDDNGDNWSKADDLGAERGVARIIGITDRNGDEVLFCALGTSGSPYAQASIWMSTDDGDTWREYYVMVNDVDAWHEQCAAITEVNSAVNILLAGTGNHSAKSRVWKHIYK